MGSLKERRLTVPHFSVKGLQVFRVVKKVQGLLRRGSLGGGGGGVHTECMEFLTFKERDESDKSDESPLFMEEQFFVLHSVL